MKTPIKYKKHLYEGWINDATFTLIVYRITVGFSTIFRFFLQKTNGRPKPSASVV